MQKPWKTYRHVMRLLSTLAISTCVARHACDQVVEIGSTNGWNYVVNGFESKVKQSESE
jgi:hypothetical protein